MGLCSALMTAYGVLYRSRFVLFVVGAPLAFFFIDRLVALKAILDVSATEPERSTTNQLNGILLGTMEDLLITLLLCFGLLALDVVAASLAIKIPNAPVMLLRFGRSLRAISVFVLVILTIAPFAADMLLLRIRDMRFTTDLLETYRRERDQATTLEVEPREIRLAILSCAGVGVFALVFTGVYVRWIDLDLLLLSRPATHNAFKPVAASTPLDDLEMASHGQGDDLAMTDSSSPSDAEEDDDIDQGSGGFSIKPVQKARGPARTWSTRFSCGRGARVLVLIMVWILVLGLCCKISHAISPVVAAIALNATLNELFRSSVNIQFVPSSGSVGIPSAAYYLQPETETYELFQNDVLYRKTTGFNGPLAFDVKVEERNPPNVLVLAVESFRYMDSLLMAANTTAGALMQKHNLTVTPQFDRYAKRNVAFTNMWSSWQTSRSLEAILFGQVAYDSVTDSGTTHGKRSTNLAGMPQFFKQKGYETVFTTGCIVTYDQWDKFLPSHGFDSLMAAPEMKTYAQNHYNISKKDWNGPPHRGFNWGVHDDVSFKIIGDIMVNKTQAQAERMKRGERKQPFFLNHYTISSHHTFDAHPTWLDKLELPDFSPLCEGFENQCELIKKYAKLRYFTDMELGKFLDRMKAAGVLDDTIVVIVGDHGQSPEMGLATPFIYQTAVTHVASALIAEGRLGESAGKVFDDATHHYDLLNTLADIVGVPAGGFLQTGVGRSLKRKIPFGERLVWSNNPMKKMAVVRGHERFVYDHISNDMGLFNTIADPLEKTDLLPSQPNKVTTSWFAKRDAGRDLNSYFKERWDNKCLTKVSC